jgi:DNA-binding MarR family transcriptional regulator
MTTTPTLNGRIIGQAERATRALLENLLSTTGIGFHRWVILTNLATAGDTLPEAELVDRVAVGLTIPDADVCATIDELVELGLTERSRADGTVSLTPAGQARHDGIQAALTELTAGLYGDLPPADLATAAQVLTLVTERARARLAR